jgi:Lon-like protease
VPDGLHVVKISTLHQARLDVAKIAAGDGTGLPSC